MIPATDIQGSGFGGASSDDHVGESQEHIELTFVLAQSPIAQLPRSDTCGQILASPDCRRARLSGLRRAVHTIAGGITLSNMRSNPMGG